MWKSAFWEFPYIRLYKLQAYPPLSSLIPYVVGIRCAPTFLPCVSAHRPGISPFGPSCTSPLFLADHRWTCPPPLQPTCNKVVDKFPASVKFHRRLAAPLPHPRGFILTLSQLWPESLTLQSVQFSCRMPLRWHSWRKAFCSRTHSALNADLSTAPTG